MNRKNRPENIEDAKIKGERLEALIKLCQDIREKERRVPISFNDFLFHSAEEPEIVFRNIFQVFHDMVHSYIKEERDEYPKSSESIGFIPYDCSSLFIKDLDNPFFADRLFANRFMNLVRNFKKGNINNQIYLFEGPPGSGKSTFLNNLLKKLEVYTSSKDGIMYNSIWRIDIESFGGLDLKDLPHFNIIDETHFNSETPERKKIIEISCPNQDHPILQIPKSLRKNFLEALIPDPKFKKMLFTSKEYEWVLKDTPCSICSSIYTSLLDRLGDPLLVFNMLHARRALYSRQFGEGISIFNPGDPVINRPIVHSSIQDMLNKLLKTNEIRFMYSYLANTNNGVLALMDIKEQNIDRLLSLHGIVSDGVHKVEFIEERIKSLFVGLVNPEDKKHYENIKSFKDRIVTVNIPYILDYKTEVAIYQNKFGANVKNFFLPGIIENFAKIIISTRLNIGTPGIKKWIPNAEKYYKYIDKNLLLLKMDIYTGSIPEWIDDEDDKRFDAQIRKEIIDDSEKEGVTGFSGRQSINVFNDFYKTSCEKGKLFTMSMLKDYFLNLNITSDYKIPIDFINSLETLYDYDVLQQVKESIYYFNKTQITNDILNYLFAINYDSDVRIKSEYTGDMLEINEDYFKNFEAIFIGTTAAIDRRMAFRKETHKEYITNTVTQEIRIQKKKITDTELFTNLYERYVNNLKENALVPFADNDSFRRALVDYGTSSYTSYDNRLKRDIEFMLENLQKKYDYDKEGAKQIALYVLDKKLVTKY
ncbi:MAG: serine protein kinase PrkA [Bacteroidota bacterium]